MLSNDVYRAKLRLTMTSLQYWVPSISDMARCEVVETADYGKITLSSFVEGGCPVELMLRADQLYDIVIAGELYEDRPVKSLDLFQPLLEAIIDGRVIQRRWFAMATGIERGVETIVTMADGRVWRDSHVDEAVAGAIPEAETECRDRRFLPYRR